MDLTTIEYVHVGLVIQWAKSPLDEALSIPTFIEYIEEDCQAARLEAAARWRELWSHSYCLFLYNFDGMMATETDPLYCIVYPVIFKPSIPQEEHSHYDSEGAPSQAQIHECMCCALLHHIDHTHVQQQKHHQGQLVIPRGAQYSCLLPSVVISCNHCPPIIQFGGGVTFPMASIGDFMLDGKLFPRSPGDSLLYNDKEITELQH